MRAPRKQDQNKADPSKPDATITFTFESAYNQIVQPLSYVSLSQYFIAHWMPSISPAGLKILLQLRSMGYYNPKAAVQRGDIDIDQKELASLCGMSHSTLKRAFGDDPILSAYVQRVFETKRDPLTGRIIKEHYVYVVKMDDVLTPQDKARLEDLLQGPDKQNPPTPPLPVSPMGQNELSDAPPMGQNEPRGVQNEPPTAHNEPPMGQNDPSLKGVFITSTTLNTSDTPGAAPELPASLFGEPEQDVLDSLSREEFAALEAKARVRVIENSVDPVRRLAREGKAWTSVKPMMRKLLAGREPWGSDAGSD